MRVNVCNCRYRKYSILMEPFPRKFPLSYQLNEMEGVGEPL
jgi:hypothetical protein